MSLKPLPLQPACPAPAPLPSSPGPSSPLFQDLASFGYWNLRAAMLNCLPVTMATSSKGHEHEHNPFETSTHEHHEHEHATVTGARADSSGSSSTQQPVGADAFKAQHPDTLGKQQQQQQPTGEGQPMSCTPNPQVACFPACFLVSVQANTFPFPVFAAAAAAVL